MRTAAAGLVVRVGRIGAVPARLVLAPARVVARSPRVEGAVRSGVESVAVSAGGVLETEAARAVDGVLAGPLPEVVARSLVERRVVERVVGEVLASGALEGMVASATADEHTERIVQQVLTSPAMERLLMDALDSRLTLELTERLLRNPEFQRVIAAAVRDGLARQTATLADSMAASARRLDAAIEAAPRRWLRRPPRPQAVPSGEPAVPYAGLGSRAAALSVDGVAVHVVFLIGCAVYLLVVGLIDRDRRTGWPGRSQGSAGRWWWPPTSWLFGRPRAKRLGCD